MGNREQGIGNRGQGTRDKGQGHFQPKGYAYGNRDKKTFLTSEF
jgi:hypothetical protein